MQKKITKGTLNRIKKRLPVGWKNTIADELKLQPETVRKVMGGIRRNNLVLEKAIILSRLPETEKTKLINQFAASC